MAKVRKLILAYNTAFTEYLPHTDLTDRTDIVRDGALTVEHEIILNTRFAEGPLTEGR